MIENICKISWKKLQNIIAFFEQKDGKLYHSRIDEELAIAAENSHKSKERTAAATAARKAKTKNVTNDVTMNVTFTPSPSPIEDYSVVDTDVSTPSFALTHENAPAPNIKKPPKKPPRISFDFENRSFSGITDVDRTQWGEAYPALDIEREIRKMAVWLVANPENRKSNYPRFINKWLTREQDRAGRKTQGIPQRSFFGDQGTAGSGRGGYAAKRTWREAGEELIARDRYENRWTNPEAEPNSVSSGQGGSGEIYGGTDPNVYHAPAIWENE